MRSLTKDANVQLAANYIVSFFRNRFSNNELQLEKELCKLQKEKVVLEIQKEELEK